MMKKLIFITLICCFPFIGEAQSLNPRLQDKWINTMIDSIAITKNIAKYEGYIYCDVILDLTKKGYVVIYGCGDGNSESDPMKLNVIDPFTFKMDGWCSEPTLKYNSSKDIITGGGSIYRRVKSSDNLKIFDDQKLFMKYYIDLFNLNAILQPGESITFISDAYCCDELYGVNLISIKDKNGSKKSYIYEIKDNTIYLYERKSKFYMETEECKVWKGKLLRKHKLK